MNRSRARWFSSGRNNRCVTHFAATPQLALLMAGGVVALYLLVECCSLIRDGTSVIRKAWRFVRSRKLDSRYLKLPEELKIAAANGLISVGSELIVGHEPEWSGTAVRRFAVSPADSGEQSGTVLRIIGMSRGEAEVVRVSPPAKGSNP
jgi:hypothetical protein